MSQEGHKSQQEGEPLREVVQELRETPGEMTDEQRNRLRKAMPEETWRRSRINRRRQAKPTHESLAITQKMNQVCDELGSPQDAVWAAVAEAALRRIEW